MLNLGFIMIINTCIRHHSYDCGLGFYSGDGSGYGNGYGDGSGDGSGDGDGNGNWNG